jgi:hypothetical protein
MKKQLLILAAACSLPLFSNAATLFFDSTSLETSSGSDLTSGIIRFGTFLPGTNFNQSIADLADEFIQLGTYTIASSAFNTSLFYANNVSYSSGDLAVTRPYDNTPLDNSDVTTDIARETIYAWVLNDSNNLLVTEHGIFSAAAFGSIWTDAQEPGDSNSFITFDLTTGDGFEAAIGTASSDLGVSGHRLAAIPEPSRALLGLIGLTGVMFRRRRAAKA